MRCEEINALLDQLLDGELTDEQLRALEEHGQSCPDCAGEIRAAMQMKALFGEMEPEVDVPLAAQAAWRGAIKAEAKRKRNRKIYSWAGMAAAAVVVMLGVSLALNTPNAPKMNADQRSAVAVESAGGVEAAGAVGDETDAVEAKSADMTVESNEAIAPEVETAGAAEAYGAVDYDEAAYDAQADYEAEEADDAGAMVEAPLAFALEMADVAYLEPDGAVDSDYAVPMPESTALPAATAMPSREPAPETAAKMAEAAAPATSGGAAAPVHEVALKVESIDAACGDIEDLVSEYEGVADVQRVDGGANIFVHIPAENVAEFISAVAHLDSSEAGIAAPDTQGEEMSTLLLTLTE